MSLRLQLLQIARLAPRLPDDSVDPARSIVAFDHGRVSVVDGFVGTGRV